MLRKCQVKCHRLSRDLNLTAGKIPFDQVNGARKLSLDTSWPTLNTATLQRFKQYCTTLLPVEKGVQHGNENPTYFYKDEMDLGVVLDVVAADLVAG